MLETVVLLRDDVYHVSEGRKQVSTCDLASDVLEDVVFPVMVDGAVSTLPGPLSLLARPVVWLPRKLIGRTVGLAIENPPGTPRPWPTLVVTAVTSIPPVVWLLLGSIAG